MDTSKLLAALRQILPGRGVSVDPLVLGPLLLDNRARYRGRALCACFPDSVAQVSPLFRTLAEFGALIVPQGGNTGNAAAATPLVSAAEAGRTVLVSAARLNRVERIDPVNELAVVQAGVVADALRRELEPYRLMFPVQLAASGSCTIGGMLATNAGGVHVIRYGSARASCLGLEVVLADGRVMDMTRELRKDNTGYQLRDLFIGSEGTLGFITRAVLALRPRPEARQVLVIALPELRRVETVFARLARLAGPRLSAFELMQRAPLALVARLMPQVRIGFALSSEWYALCEFESQRATDLESLRQALTDELAALLAEGALSDAVLAGSERQNEELWRARESIPAASKLNGGELKHDISLPRSRVVEFITECGARLGRLCPWAEPRVFGHFGDGNLHYNVALSHSGDPSETAARERLVSEVVYGLTREFRGSVAAEHGVGRIKRELLREVRRGPEYETMLALKRALDPDQRMNPGALFDLSSPR